MHVPVPWALPRIRLQRLFASVKTKNLPREHAGAIVPDRTEMLELKNIRFNAALGEMTAVEFADHLRIAFGAIAH